jgi:hypothetical protein
MSSSLSAFMVKGVQSLLPPGVVSPASQMLKPPPGALGQAWKPMSPFRPGAAKTKSPSSLVLANGLHSGGVPENALAHAAAVDVHAERWEVAVEVEATVFLVEAEGGVVDTADNVVTVAVDAAGLVVLGRSVDDETAVLSLDVAVLDSGAAAERHQAEDIAGSGAGEGSLGGKGRSESGHGGGGGSGGELHDDGWWWY